MKNTFTHLIFCLVIAATSISTCFAQEVVWTVTDNPSSSNDIASAICSDDTYIYVAGYDIIHGNRQWRIQKRNKSDGSAVWTKTDDPSSSNDGLMAVTSDDSYIYLCGYDGSPGYEQWRMQKRNKSDGAVVWTVTDNPSGSAGYASSITCDDTYIYVAGSDRSPGDEQWKIQKRNKSDGSIVWTKTENPSSEWEGAQVIISDDSYIYISGGDYSPVGFGDTQCRIQKRNKSDGSVVWTKTENPSSTYDGIYDITSDDTYLYTAGHDSSLGGLHDDQWRIQKRYKSDGSIVWTKTENLSSSYDTAYAITSDDNSIYITGRDSSPGYFNFQWRTQKRNKSDGAVIWTKTENPSSDQDCPVAITSDGTYIYIAGRDGTQGDWQWRIQKIQQQAELACETDILFDDFDDGNIDDWSAIHPHTGIPTTLPDIVSSPQGYSLRGVGSGYSHDPGLNVWLSRPLSLSNADQLKVEMRAKSGTSWPSSAWIILKSGTDSYSFGDYGEGNQWAQFTPNVDGQSEWHNYPINANVWHDFAWTRDADGWWSLNIDGGPVEWPNFCQDNRLTSFDQIGLHTLRNQSEIEWVRVSVPCEPPTEPDIDVLLDINPDTLNVNSHGKWITVYITLPDGYNVDSIIHSSIVIASIQGQTCPSGYEQFADPDFIPQVGDRDEDDIPDLTVKFDRQELIPNLCMDDVSIKIEGDLITGEHFSGTDTIRVFQRGK